MANVAGLGWSARPESEDRHWLGSVGALFVPSETRSPFAAAAVAMVSGAELVDRSFARIRSSRSARIDFNLPAFVGYFTKGTTQKNLYMAR